jgi:hypothetical protein
MGDLAAGQRDFHVAPPIIHVARSGGERNRFIVAEVVAPPHEGVQHAHVAALVGGQSEERVPKISRAAAGLHPTPSDRFFQRDSRPAGGRRRIETSRIVTRGFQSAFDIRHS